MTPQFWCGKGRPHTTEAGRDACQMETAPCATADFAAALKVDVVIPLNEGRGSMTDALAHRSWFDVRQESIRGLTKRPGSRRPTSCPQCGSTYRQKFNGGDPVWLCDCDDMPGEADLEESLIEVARWLGQCPEPGCIHVRGHSGRCPYIDLPTECPECHQVYKKVPKGNRMEWICLCNPERCVVCDDGDGTVEWRNVTRRSRAKMCARCGNDARVLEDLAQDGDDL